MFRIDIATRKVELWKQITALDALYGILGLRVSLDGGTYVYDIISNTSDLYLLDGVE